jgi:hypothetical protein
MKYETIETYSDEDFRRITGIKRTTFYKMTEILKEAYDNKHKKRGRHAKLSIENMLLATLEYWREYRTYAHIAASYDINESNIFRIIKWVENILIKNGVFSLPGKKSLLKSEAEYEIVLIDATESPVERPKKNKKNSILERKKDTP